MRTGFLISQVPTSEAITAAPLPDDLRTTAKGTLVAGPSTPAKQLVAAPVLDEDRTTHVLFLVAVVVLALTATSRYPIPIP